MITVTDSARDKFKELLAAKNDDNLVLYLSIAGRGPVDFQYNLRIIPLSDKGADDQVVETNGLTFIVDGASTDQLDGASIDFINTAGGGFKIDNPNPMWDDPVMASLQQFFSEHINPGLASHGGFVTLLDVKDNKVYVQLGGGCVGCGLANVTLKQGIEVMIRQEFPEIEAVIDQTDHASGTNPYYQPSKGGPAHAPSK